MPTNDVQRAYLDAAQSALELSRGFVMRVDEPGSDDSLGVELRRIRTHMNNAEDRLVFLRAAIPIEDTDAGPAA